MQDVIRQAVAAVSNVVLGKEEQIRLAISCMLARGHLERGHLLAVQAQMNPQVSWGEDVISRIGFCQSTPKA